MMKTGTEGCEGLLDIIMVTAGVLSQSDEAEIPEDFTELANQLAETRPVVGLLLGSTA
jgi:hypothetical protein